MPGQFVLEDTDLEGMQVAVPLEDQPGQVERTLQTIRLFSTFGQVIIKKSTERALGIGVLGIDNQPADDYQVFRDEDLRGYEDYLDDFIGVWNPQEAAAVKNIIEINRDLRLSISEVGIGTHLVAGFLDPINLMPIPLVVGKGFFGAIRAATPAIGGIIVGSEALRHHLDPTSTPEETFLNVVGGLLFAGVVSGSVGHFTSRPKGAWPAHFGSPRDVFNKIRKAAESRVGTPQRDVLKPGGKGKRVGGKRAVEAQQRAIDDIEAGRGTVKQTKLLEKASKKQRLAKETLFYRAGDSIDDIQAHASDGFTIFSVKNTVDADLIHIVAGPRGLRVVKMSDDNVGIPPSIPVVESSRVTIEAGTPHPDLPGGKASKTRTTVIRSIAVEDGVIPVPRKSTLGDEQMELDDAGVPRFLREEETKAAEVVSDTKRAAKSAKKDLNEAEARIKTAGSKAWVTRRQKERDVALEDWKRKDWYQREAINHQQRVVRRINDKSLTDDPSMWELVPTHTGLEKVMGNLEQFPFYFLIYNPLRKLAPDLAADYQKFAYQVAGTPGLASRANVLGWSLGPSVENMSRVRQGPALAAKLETDRIYFRYLGYSKEDTNAFDVYIKTNSESYGRIKRFGRNVKNRAFGDELETKPTVDRDGKFTLEEWRRQVGTAVATGRHDNEFVRQAAKLWRKVFDDFEVEARRLEIFQTQQTVIRRIAWLETRLTKEDLPQFRKDDLMMELDDLNVTRANLKDVDLGGRWKLEGEAGYFHRMLVLDAVVAKEPRLAQILRNWYRKHPRIEVDEKGLKYSVADDADALEARVQETISSMKREAEYGDSDFASSHTDKQDWLLARRTLMEEIVAGTKTLEGTPPKVAKARLKIIERKLDRVRDGEGIGGGPSALMGRRLDIPNHLLIPDGFIELNIEEVMFHYSARMAPLIEMAKKFGDHRASAHIDDLMARLQKRIDETADPKIKAKLEKAQRSMYTSMTDLRDIVLGIYQIPKNMHEVTGRLLRLARNWSAITSMGKATLMALADTGKIIQAYGFRATFGQGLARLGRGVHDNVRMMDHEVIMAGSVTEVATGLRYRQWSEVGFNWYGMKSAEKSITQATQRFFLHNLMAPWTDMAKKVVGGIAQSQIIKDGLALRAGTLSAARRQEIAKLLPEDVLLRIVDEWEGAGKIKHGDMFVANSTEWVNPETVSLFRGAIDNEVNAHVITPGAPDKPKILLKSEWAKIIGQYKGFGLSATHRILMSSLQMQEKRRMSGLLSMVAIAMVVDALKKPDYLELPLDEQIFRAVELSGVTGLILDLNDTIERMSGGGIGLRPLIGMRIRERNPTWATMLGATGAVPHQWLTLMWALTSDEAETSDVGRAVRYVIPYNNLLYTSDIFNRLQRSTVNFVEGFD